MPSKAPLTTSFIVPNWYTKDRASQPFTGFISLEIEIICEIPKSWPNKKKGLALEQKVFPRICDMDNQIKALSDAMNGVASLDDRFVNHIVAKRRYGRDERAVVIVRLIDQS